MTTERAHALAGFLLASGLALLAVGAIDCAAASGAADAAYTAQTLACVADASTLVEAKACRAKVKAEYGLDAGGSQ